MLNAVDNINGCVTLAVNTGEGVSKSLSELVCSKYTTIVCKRQM